MNRFLEYQVQDVMSRPVCLRGEATLAQLEALLEEHGWNGIPVVDADDRPVGFVTALDLLAAFDFSEDEILPAYDRVLARPIAEIMSRDVRTVTPRTPLPRALRKLVDTRNKSLMVVDAGRVVGILAREDVMRALRRAALGKRPGDA